MGTLALVIGVAVIAALGGYLVGRRPRRARRVFIAGFVCGSAAGSILQGRRRRLANHALRRIVGGGVAAFDCDDDGRPELYLAGGANPAALFHNDSPVGARALGSQPRRH